jgi:hypothetical protein
MATYTSDAWLLLHHLALLLLPLLLLGLCRMAS